MRTAGSHNQWLVDSAPMEQFNRTIAIRVFFGVVAIDVVFMVLVRLTSDSAWTVVPWWIVNFPGFPLLYVLLPVMPFGLSGIICSVICAGLFSALLWSAVAGILFRHKFVALPDTGDNAGWPSQFRFAVYVVDPACLSFALAKK